MSTLPTNTIEVIETTAVIPLTQQPLVDPELPTSQFLYDEVIRLDPDPNYTDVDPDSAYTDIVNRPLPQGHEATISSVRDSSRWGCTQVSETHKFPNTISGILSAALVIEGLNVTGQEDRLTTYSEPTEKAGPEITLTRGIKSAASLALAGTIEMITSSGLKCDDLTPSQGAIVADQIAAQKLRETPGMESFLFKSTDELVYSGYLQRLDESGIEWIAYPGPDNEGVNVVIYTPAIPIEELDSLRQTVASQAA